MTEDGDLVGVIYATMWTYPALDTAVMVQQTDGDPVVARTGPGTTPDG